MALPEAARQHATRVIRLDVGDPLLVFDAGREFSATITAIERHRVLIEVAGRTEGRPERPVPIHLIMSPLKGDLTELVIQKSTELGVASITPALFERTDTVARREPTEARTQRWNRVAASAAEQSGRCVVPKIDALVELKQALASIGPLTEGQLRIVAAEPSLVVRPSASAPNASSVRTVVVAVGPAGGLGPTDLEALSAASFSPERFALHTLRSETACLAAIAVLGARYR